jgi:general secretion pathway protein H
MDALARAPARGFTLIEVMVIVLIVGVVSAALAIATAPGEAAIAEREARRLAALLELAMAESRASGQSMGWSPEGNGYSFWWRTDGGDWARYPENSVYRSRAFPAKIELANVHVDGREVASGDRVTFSPVGLRSAIRATLSAGNAQIDLRGGVLGRVSTQRLHPD